MECKKEAVEASFLRLRENRVHAAKTAGDSLTDKKPHGKDNLMRLVTKAEEQVTSREITPDRDAVLPRETTTMKMLLSVAFGLLPLSLPAQVSVADGSARVVVVINGKTYSGSLPQVVSNETTTTPLVTNDTTKASLPPRLIARLPVTPTPISSTPVLTLPTQMMTSAWPLNQPALQYPDETRSLKSSAGDGQYTPKPIASTFHDVFGANHINFNPTMPWVVVNSTVTPDIFSDVTINFPDWGSDDGATCSAMSSKATVSAHWPVKVGVIEGADNPTGDRHVLVMDLGMSRLYELDGVSLPSPGITPTSYSADAARCWDVLTPAHGVPGQNSADAAGLPILPLLLRYDEASSGTITHALRFTMNLTRANANGGAFTLPASHAAGGNWSSMAYMGMRLRLRPDFDTRPFSAINQTIAVALKTYGIVLTDNGKSGLVVADSDTRWNTDDLNMLGGSITLNDFIPVNSGPIIDSSGADVQ